MKVRGAKDGNVKKDREEGLGDCTCKVLPSARYAGAEPGAVRETGGQDVGERGEEWETSSCFSVTARCRDGVIMVLLPYVPAS